LKEEALDRTLWRTRFGRGYGLVIRQTTEWMVSYCANTWPCPSSSFLSKRKRFKSSIHFLRQENYKKCETYYVLSTVLSKFPSPGKNSCPTQGLCLQTAKLFAFQQDDCIILYVMTYSTSSCLVTKLWSHGMYICMYVCMYVTRRRRNRENLSLKKTVISTCNFSCNIFFKYNLYSNSDPSGIRSY
jgi:hypothetical protein